MQKIIFSDYDGTLDTSVENITENIEAIKKFRQKCNLFVIATGRSYPDLKRKLDLYPIPFDYLILNHGSVILNKDKDVISSCLISKNIVLELLQLITKHHVEKIILFDIFNKDIKNVSNEITKIMLEIDTKDLAINLSDKINYEYKDSVKSYVIKCKDIYLLEIISVNTDKSQAIEKVLELENIPDEFVYPIGDGINDVEMILKYDGFGMKKSSDIIYKTTNKLCHNVAQLIDLID